MEQIRLMQILNGDVLQMTSDTGTSRCGHDRTYRLRNLTFKNNDLGTFANPGRAAPPPSIG